VASTSVASSLKALLPSTVTVLSTDDMTRAAAASVAASERVALSSSSSISPDDVVFFQLTSGSTGTPKAIPETHRAVISHIRHSVADCGYRSSDVTLNWLPFDHVVPMLTFHMKDVYVGCDSVQAPTAEVVGEPLRWLRLIQDHRVTHSWAPNFGFKLIAQALRQRRGGGGGGEGGGESGGSGGGGCGYDLSTLKFLMNAGEQVTAAVCDEFIKLTGVPARVVQPAFGMAEVGRGGFVVYFVVYSCIHTTPHTLKKHQLVDYLPVF
jgi:acyl-CoA synthetase (AMP-forming)/AMP-acid ligase II